MIHNISFDEKENKRMAWIDIAKGIAIILVVFGHVITNGQSSDLLHLPVWTIIHNTIYSFHMPLFFFISGYLQKHCKREDNKMIAKALFRKEICLLIPYALFSFLYLLSKVIFSNSNAVVHSVSI